jgi:hypothetical protein
LPLFLLSLIYFPSFFIWLRFSVLSFDMASHLTLTLRPHGLWLARTISQEMES